LKILDKRIETIDKQIGEMCLKKSIDNNPIINQKPYNESVNNYYNATFNKPIQNLNYDNNDYYQQQNNMVPEEIDVEKNNLNYDDHEEIDNLYQDMQNMEIEDKDEKDIYEIIN